MSRPDLTEGASGSFVRARARKEKRPPVKRGSFNLVATNKLFLVIQLPLTLVKIMNLFFNRVALQ
jgi:hypothetical protein